MEFNSLLFPAPQSSYSSSTNLGDLIYIPKYERDAHGNIIPFEKPPLLVQESLPTKTMFEDPMSPSRNFDLRMSEPALKLRSV